MNKTELIDAIAAETRLSGVNTKKAVEASFSSVEKALTNGNKASTVGSGVWSVVEGEAKDVRNPRTGEVVRVFAKKVVKFKTGAKLADAVNK